GRPERDDGPEDPAPPDRREPHPLPPPAPRRRCIGVLPLVSSPSRRPPSYPPPPRRRDPLRSHLSHTRLCPAVPKRPTGRTRSVASNRAKTTLSRHWSEK